MTALLTISKFSGARCGDLLNLRWNQIQIDRNSIACNPIRYKNARLGRRWRFSIEATNDVDCPVLALSKLKNSKPFLSNDRLFGNWTTSNVDQQFAKAEESIGFKLSLHKIRVTITILLTAANWSDKEIMNFLNWQDFESLDRYRRGVNLNEIRGKGSFKDLWSDTLNEKDHGHMEVSKWTEKFKKI